MIFFKNLKDVQKRLNIPEEEMPLHFGSRYDWIVFHKEDSSLSFCCGFDDYKVAKRSNHFSHALRRKSEILVSNEWLAMMFSFIEKYGDKI